MITLDNATFGYGRAAPLFEAFSWHVAPGEVWAVLGPSGCGKSTLLLLLAGLLHPQGGEVRIAGERIVRPRPRTGLILQEYGLLPWATVEDNVALGLRVRRFYGPDGHHAPRDAALPREEIAARVAHWLSRWDLAPLANQDPAQEPGDGAAGQHGRCAFGVRVQVGDVAESGARRDRGRLDLVAADADADDRLSGRHLEVARGLLQFSRSPDGLAVVEPFRLDACRHEVDELQVRGIRGCRP